MISTLPSRKQDRLWLKPRPSWLHATRGLPRSYAVIRHRPTCSQRSSGSRLAPPGKANTPGKVFYLAETVQKIASSIKEKILSLQPLSLHIPSDCRRLWSSQRRRRGFWFAVSWICSIASPAKLTIFTSMRWSVASTGRPSPPVDTEQAAMSRAVP